MYGLELILDDLKTKDRNYLQLIAKFLNDKASKNRQTNFVLRLSDGLSKENLIGIVIYLAGEFIRWGKNIDIYDEPAVAGVIGAAMDRVDNGENSS